MSNNKKIVYSIIKFLKDELTTLSPEACESLEVAIQCLENAYEIHSDDPSLDTGTSLAKLFESQGASTSSKIATPAEKEQAEKLKTEGNELVKAEKFEEAVQCYTKAIQLDPNNPVYYCNRALAYNRLNNHQATIDDCKIAIKIDPTYSRPYGRLGLAYSSLSMFEEAKKSYEKALELEPGNQTYIKNLEVNEEIIKNRAEGSMNGGPRVPNLENLDLNSFLGNPSVLSMATQVMADPAMQNMMTTLMNENVGENTSGIEALLQVGQRVAQHMQSTNPDLVEQLRQQLSNAAANSQNPQPKQN